MVDRQLKGDNETIHRTKDNAVIRVVQDKYDGRRKFEVLEAPDRPEELAEKAADIPRNLKNLEGRAGTLNLESQVGKVNIITKDNANTTQSGFYCKHCDCLMKDSNAWLDHINGTKHNKLLGMNMKVERVGVDRVRDRLKGLKKASEGQPITSMEDFEKKFEEEQKRKAEKALKDKTHRKQLKTENAAIEAKLQELESEIPDDFGLPISFGSSKKR